METIKEKLKYIKSAGFSLDDKETEIILKNWLKKFWHNNYGIDEKGREYIFKEQFNKLIKEDQN